jgi:hypothetical protein
MRVWSVERQNSFSFIKMLSREKIMKQYYVANGGRCLAFNQKTYRLLSGAGSLKGQPHR